MKQQSKLSEKPEHAEEQHTQPRATHEFKNSDELLRFDASQISVPPEIAARLEHSTQNAAPKKSSGWFARIFGVTHL